MSVTDVKRDKVTQSWNVTTEAAAGEVKVTVTVRSTSENGELARQTTNKVAQAVQEALLQEGATAGQ